MKDYIPAADAFDPYHTSISDRNHFATRRRMINAIHASVVSSHVAWRTAVSYLDDLTKIIFIYAMNTLYRYSTQWGVPCTIPASIHTESTRSAWRRKFGKRSPVIGAGGPCWSGDAEAGYDSEGGDPTPNVKVYFPEKEQFACRFGGGTMKCRYWSSTAGSGLTAPFTGNWCSCRGYCRCWCGGGCCCGRNWW